jgi:hypothetical protein
MPEKVQPISWNPKQVSKRLLAVLQDRAKDVVVSPLRSWYQ